MLDWPNEQLGALDGQTTSIQYLLDERGAKLVVDGNFGPLTQAAVEDFQRGKGLTPDGIVGNLTWPKLIIEVYSGSTGDAVKAVQDQINARTRPELVVDGVFGPVTDAAVRSFQANFALTVDGIVGPITWNTFMVVRV